MPLPGGHSAALGALFVVCGCAYSRDGPSELSVFVTAAVQDADSIVVRFATAAGVNGSTPAFVSNGDSMVVVVLGLFPATEYGAQLVAFNRCGMTESPPASFTTSPLPVDLPAY